MILKRVGESGTINMFVSRNNALLSDQISPQDS